MWRLVRFNVFIRIILKYITYKTNILELLRIMKIINIKYNVRKRKIDK